MFAAAQQAIINTLLLKKDLFSFLDLLAKTGNPVSVVPLMEGNFYLVNHPDLVRRVLLADEEEISKPEFLLQSNRGKYGDGLTSLTGAAWEARRRASARALSPAVMQGMVRHARTATEQLIDAIRQSEPFSDKPIELSALILKLVIDIGACWILSSKVVTDASEEGIPSTEAFGAWQLLDIQGVASDLMPNRRIRAETTPVLREIIRKKWCWTENPSDFISAFYSTCQAQGLVLSEEEVFDEIVQLLFAPHHTVTTTLINCIHFLHRYPEIAQEVKCCAQLNRALAIEHPENKLNNEKKTTEYFIKEVMRFCMPTPLLFRQTRRPIDLDGTQIAAGELIVISPYLLHRDARWFSNPDRFEPQRFSQAVDSYAYLPFGAGARRCVAHRLALMQMKTVVESLVLSGGIHPLTELPSNLFAVSWPGSEYWVKFTFESKFMTCTPQTN